MRLIPFLCLCFTAFFLTACGPVFKTMYDYTPPRGSMGKMCIAQCFQNKNMCEQMCQMNNQNCKVNQRQEALYRYEAYVREQHVRHEPVDKRVSDFDDSFFACSNTCNCTPAFNSCYSMCGGEVSERTVCVANCDKQ